MTRRMRASRVGGEVDGERGQALVLFVLFVVVLLAALALVVNGGVLRRSNQELWNALDAGALAGVQSLPANASQAASDARRFALLNNPDISSLTVSFRCLVGDRNGDGSPDAADVPAVCDPGSSASWTCADGKCVSPCDPALAGQVCNTVVIEGTVATDYQMSGITGVAGADTTYQSAACIGVCGADPTVPLDIGLILDRTGSMSDADLANVENAALETLRILDPAKQSVAIAALGPSKRSASCQGSNGRGVAAPAGQSSTWIISPYPYANKPLVTDYQNADGTLNTNSQLVESINCLDHSSVGTNLGDPLRAMADELINYGRPGVAKGILLMTDGAANQPNSNSCAYANDAATAVKNRGVELFTIGFGVVGDQCVDATGPFVNAYASTLLASMADQPTVDNGCTNAENTDGDHYYCEPRGSDLSSVFKAAATALIQGSAHLVMLPGS
jgi:hypothetical protein